MMMNEQKIDKLRRKMNMSMNHSLLERAPKKLRGVTIDLNNILTLRFFFDEALDDEEEEDIECVYEDVFASWWGDYLGEKFNDITYDKIVVDCSLSIKDQVGNLGWFYLRHEY